MKKYTLAMMVVLLVSLNFSIAVQTTAQEKWPEMITIGSYPKASTSYPTNMAIAKLISKYTPAKAVIREFPGGTPGIEAITRGAADTWGNSQSDYIFAYYAENIWKDKPQDIRLLIGTWYMGSNGFGVRPADKINSLKDFAGKRVFTKSFSVFLNQCGEKILKKAGVYDKITHLNFASTTEIASAMIDKKADGFLWGTEGAWCLEIKQSVGLDWVSPTEEEMDPIKEVAGAVNYKMPKWVLEMYNYPPNRIIRGPGYCFAIAIRANMPDHVVRGILEAIYDKNHLDEVRSLSNVLTDIDIKDSVKHFWIPFHAEAVRFYKDKGVWTAEMEAKQKEFLAKRGFSK